uniref:BspA family leucine-rich repeat surface protein n=1 Tax=viral metagenome TaxID=1070528 RepID=A0A6C0E0N1_9ZZZZ
MPNPAQIKAEFKASMEKKLKEKMVANANIKKQNRIQKHGITPQHSHHSGRNTTILIYDLPESWDSEEDGIQLPVWGSDYWISWGCDDEDKVYMEGPTDDESFPVINGLEGGRQYIIKIYGNVTQFGLDKTVTNPEDSGCTGIQYLIEVEKIGPSILTYAFLGATNLVKVPKKLPCNVDDLDLTGMFAGCSSFNYPINCWDVSEVTNMDFMFYNASEFNQRLNKWDTHAVLSMEGMFSGASNFNQPLNCWDVSNVANMAGMFSGASNFNQPLNCWDVSNVEDMSNMFANASKFNQPLDKWDTSSVTDMSGMFSGAIEFNQPLNSWDVSAVTNMFGMFSVAFKFNQPLDKWNTSSVTDMSGMFAFAASFNQPLFGTNPEYIIQNYNVGSVEDMTAMFFFATSFNQPLDLWDVSNVISNYDFAESGDYIGGMTGMFAFAKNFNQPLQNWDTKDVLNMSYMFLDATSFNQPLNNWNVSSVVNMTYMFYLASSFNQSLHLWDIHNISEDDNKGAENMLDYCGMSQYNWQTTLIGWYNICNPQMITNKPNVGALGLLYNMYYNWQVYGNVIGDFDPDNNGDIRDGTIGTTQAWVELGGSDPNFKSLVRKAVEYFTSITGHQEINYDT